MSGRSLPGAYAVPISNLAAGRASAHIAGHGPGALRLSIALASLRASIAASSTMRCPLYLAALASREIIASTMDRQVLAEATWRLFLRTVVHRIETWPSSSAANRPTAMFPPAASVTIASARRTTI